MVALAMGPLCLEGAETRRSLRKESFRMSERKEHQRLKRVRKLPQRPRIEGTREAGAFPA